MSKLKKYLLKDIAVSQTGPFGSQLHEKDYVQSGTPIVTVEHLGEIGFYLDNLPMVSDEDKAKLSKYTLKEGDIVFSRVGSIDRCTYVSKKEDGWLFSGRCLRVRFNEKADSKYVSYYFRQKYFKKLMLNISVGAIMPSLNTTLMNNIPLYLPSKSEQQKIAAVLSALDAKIELNQRINAELESGAKSLYDYWFVQFDFPNEKGKPYKSAGGKMVWNEKLKREIPLGWEVVELGNYAQPIRGVTYKKDEIKTSSDKNAIPILRATNITNGVIDLNDMVYVPEEAVSEEQILNKFDVLITMSSGSKAHVGKNAFYYFDQKVSFGAFCSKLSINKSMRFYVNTQMQSDSFKKYIANVGLGTNINNLTNKHITEYKLLIPPKELLLQYENIVEGFYNKIGNNVKESQTLKELRDWLLPMLMNGQVKV